MQKDLLENQVSGKVYSVKSIVIAAFFGGLLSSGYMMYYNFRKLGEPEKARRTIFIVIAIMIALLFTFFIPALANVPPILYSLVLTFATSAVAKKIQEDKLRTFVQSGGEYFSTGRIFVVCLLGFISLLAIAAAMVAIGMLLPAQENI